MILEGLKAYLEMIPDDRPGNKITGSAIGKCDRFLAYKHHGFKGDKITWKGRIVFDDGDNAHEQLRGFLRKCVPHTGWELVDEEREVSIKTPGGYEIRGHVDGVLRNLDNDERVLLEIKSMSAYAFDEGTIEDSYQRQIDGYLRGLGIERALFLYKNKNTGDLGERIYLIDNEKLDARLVAIDNIVASKSPNMVDRSYGPDKSGRLPWNCAYCDHWKRCWEGKAKEMRGPKGGRYLVL